MTTLDQLKKTFFDECDEALQQIEAGLTEMGGDGTASAETINAVFRAVHSVKGGAGIFGFEALVGFAHVFETVLDRVRHDGLATTPDVIEAMLAASDVLSDLVQMSRAGQGIDAEFGGSQRLALERIVDGGEGSDSKHDESAAADFEDLVFTPVSVDFGAPEPCRFRIELRPRASLLSRDLDIAAVFEAMHTLGPFELRADLSRVPPLETLDIGEPCVSWSATLQTTLTQAEVETLLAPIAADCEVHVLSDEPAAEPVVEASATAPVISPIEALLTQPPQSITASAEIASVAAPRAAAKAAATTTRIELEKIDRVVNMVGELVIAQAMLGQIVEELPEGAAGRLTQALDEVIHHTRELKDSVMSMRAQPVGAVFQRMPRLVRELAIKTQKKVRIEMVGETTEVDRSIIERLGDPLTHIIRNAVDHGIEAPADRIAAGKGEEGMIRLSADHRGGRIVIEIADDGAGINPDRVLQKARERGLLSADAAPSADEINNLIMLPGFSTAEQISDISGRGVGMDVVRSNIQDLGGRIALKSERGRGMMIQLALPLTLAVMDGMVIKVAGQVYVIPLLSIVECLRPNRADITGLVGTSGMLQLRGELVPVVHLDRILQLTSSPAGSDERVVVITDVGDGARYGLVVDELCGHQQVVIKSIEESYGAVPGVAAATILGNGRVAFILDVERLCDLAAQHRQAA